MKNAIAAMALLCSTPAVAGNNAGYELGGRFKRLEEPEPADGDLKSRP